MATIKSYTDIEQSKKLAEILPLESADYYHATDAGIVIITPYITYCGKERCVPAYKGAVPCWSLAALLGILQYPTLFQRADKKWGCTVWIDTVKPYSISYKDEPIDACVEMIVKLHELKML